MAWFQPTDDQVVESIIFDEGDDIDSFVDDFVYSEESYRFVHDQIMNKDGTVRKVRRFDYSRGERKLKSNVSPWEIVPWLIDLSNPNVRDPSKREGKEFRRKFRVPYPVFQDILMLTKDIPDRAFHHLPRTVTGAWVIPLELKILMVLRVQAGGLKFVDAAELTGYMTEGTACAFFKHFNKMFRCFHQETIIRPLTGDAMKESMRTYAMLGLPGCVGSVDATFIPWERCNNALQNLCSGDKGKGLLYQAVVTHNREALAIEGSYYSTLCDKITCKYMKFYEQLENGEIYNNVEYKIRTGPTEDDFVTLTEVYTISDGGYIAKSCFITAYDGFQSEPIRYRFSDWIASVRKDVECFFGILKMRFRFFKNPITLQNRGDIDNAFYVAVMFHNLILRHDGLDRLWEDDVNWDTINPVGEDDSGEEPEEDVAATAASFYVPTVHTPATFEPSLLRDLLPAEERQPGQLGAAQDFNTLRDHLANHLSIMYKEGKLRWPKTRKIIEERFNRTPRSDFPGAGDIGL